MVTIPFSVVAFDLDGTLADTSPDIAAALNRTLAEFGRPSLAPERIRAMIGGGARNLIRRALSLSGEATESLLDEAYPAYVDHYAADICGNTRPFPRVEEALDELAGKGVALALCTNKPERLSRLLVDALGWQGRFASLIGGDTLALRKPDPLPLQTAIDLAGGGRAAFVGDSNVDAETARAADVPFVAVSFGYCEGPAEALGADALIDSYDALAEALGRVAFTNR
ncbi:MAG: phosphoglycolate phosphatase [Allosphingosinicella sp.]